jgi:hypothetical protein
MFSSDGQTMMTLFPLTGPDDQSGRVQNLDRAFCAKRSGFEIFRFQEGKMKKLALRQNGC